MIYVDLVDSLMHIDAEEEALEYAERAKSRALVDLLATKQEFGSESTREDYNAIIQQQQIGAGLLAEIENGDCVAADDERAQGDTQILQALEDGPVMGQNQAFVQVW